MGIVTPLLVLLAIAGGIQDAPGPKPCEHPGAVASGDDVLPPVSKTPGEMLLYWQRHMPKHVLHPRRAEVPASYRIDEQGRVSSVCVDQGVDPVVDEAVVEIVDWEGMLAAGGQDVFLRRIAGAWIVVARVTTWVS